MGEMKSAAQLVRDQRDECARLLNAVHAVVERARRVSSSPRAVVYVAELEAALGLPAPAGTDSNGQPIGEEAGRG